MRKNLKLQLSPGLVASYNIQRYSQETEWVYSGIQNTHTHTHTFTYFLLTHFPRTHTG